MLRLGPILTFVCQEIAEVSVSVVAASNGAKGFGGTEALTAACNGTQALPIVPLL